ncbi:sigma-70 family RNA polymerase sigma factor [Clostridium autoethanogenum]|uniref:Sigma-70 family RNA polymerase sigma factor n=2 Tax=Clostridium autoethanogenum TaxID=84023 RepID=A0A3M0STR6_9CLOT|nr:sigma-70 family RNA polymerase sigma factor [Clostridium autoethanogenum]AGY76979.1 sigma-70 family RNA polymerase sigma factor [Clostridium autoethanogenum DSM 10061]ALU37122.1 RNA polymerase sigma-70 factor [Clostridium autoethanogenum DSM 10061]OVY50305.1 ECF RNA polymerase sigma factor RpoE [Clostridium autoethanogenum]RMD01235.1 sigma-70 family RNA polymerase sigma factor [Clostridium autoethanogenum]
MKINDKNFLLELKRKNPTALEYIINIYCNLVFKVVLNVLGNDNYENAKECINDVYLLIWNKSHLYNPEKSSFKNWLLAVSKYKAIDYKRSLVKQDNLQIEEQMLISNTDIENEYILREKKEELIKLLQYEHKLDRELFIRKYLLDQDMETLCKNFNLSKGAIYNRLWRTKNSIIRKLHISGEVEVSK